MLQHTFIHLPRIGRTTEKNLWEQGIHTWKDFVNTNAIAGISHATKPRLDTALRHSQRALYEGNTKHFLSLPSVETWRLWNEFKTEACYIDIETNYHNNITVLGISNGEDVWQYVRHHNMNRNAIKEVLSRHKLLVTFNGSSFDLPIIKRYFNNVIPDVPHIDLRHAARRAGLTGGLKAIEEEVGIARPETLDGVSGADALKLWHAYRSTGNKAFRDVLLEYNAEDILNLRPLANIVYDRLSADIKKSLKTTTS